MNSSKHRRTHLRTTRVCAIPLSCPRYRELVHIKHIYDSATRIQSYVRGRQGRRLVGCLRRRILVAQERRRRARSQGRVVRWFSRHRGRYNQRGVRWFFRVFGLPLHELSTGEFELHSAIDAVRDDFHFWLRRVRCVWCLVFGAGGTALG